MVESLAMLRVAILVADGFEQVELTEPRKALEEARAQTMIISPHAGVVRGWRFTDWGDRFPVDFTLEHSRIQFGALVLPGGVMSLDKLHTIPKAVQFVKAFFDSGKPVAAISHGVWLVIEAGAAQGRRIAAWPSLKTDLEHAGAEWVDQEVVVDGKLVSSRDPQDAPAFNREMIKLFRARPAAARAPFLVKQAAAL